MVAPHPDLQRRINNTDGIVDANKSEFISGLYTKYPWDYIDLNTHSVLTTTQPWIEELTISPMSVSLDIDQNIQSCWGPFFTVIDKILVLCIDFSDKPATTNISTINNRFFSTTGDTFLNYYKEVSFSTYIPTGEIHGWYRAPQPYTYYINNDNGYGLYPNNITRLVEDAIDMAIADPTIDWASFDTNGNGKIDNIIVVHAGSEAAWTGNTNDFWAHVSTLFPQKSVGGKSIYQYELVSEYIYPGATQRIGIDAHEFGHLIGLPDLYDYSNNSNGVGNYSLMGAGCWANNGLKPVHLDIWSKYKLGFINVTTDPNGMVTLNNIETNQTNAAVKITTSDTKEYFLMENRQRTLFDTYLPGDGILIWHINENQSLNNNELCFLAGLVQADGLKDLENKYNNGDAGDPFPGSTNNRIFGRYTTPNSSLCNGTARQMSITDISNSGSVMTFNSTIPVIPPPPPPNCYIVEVVTPPNITATNMIVTKSTDPCFVGVCAVTIDVIWQNTGGASGTFIPGISIDGGAPITLSSVTLSPYQNAGDVVTRTFTISTMIAAPHTICPVPN